MCAGGGWRTQHAHRNCRFFFFFVPGSFFFFNASSSSQGGFSVHFAQCSYAPVFSFFSLSCPISTPVMEKIMTLLQMWCGFVYTIVIRKYPTPNSCKDVCSLIHELDVERRTQQVKCEGVSHTAWNPKKTQLPQTCFMWLLSSFSENRIINSEEYASWSTSLCMCLALTVLWRGFWRWTWCVAHVSLRCVEGNLSEQSRKPNDPNDKIEFVP